MSGQYVEESKRKALGMYHPRFEHDNCGIGAIVNIKERKHTIPLRMHWKS